MNSNPADLQDVFDFIEENRDEYIAWLQLLCRQPSVAAQNRGMQETAALVMKFTEAIGANVELVPTSGFPVVYGEIYSGERRTLSFYNHYDVQPEDPLEEWDRDPFSADIADGRIWARGVADNKGNLIARLAAVHAYQQVRGKLPLNVKFIFEGEEEIGSPNLHEFVTNHPDKVQADACLWEAGYKDVNDRIQVALGVKGMLYVHLSVEAANTDMHSAYAAIVPSAAWRLVQALNTLKDQDERVLIPGFYDTVAQPDEAEKELLDSMPFDEAGFLKGLDIPAFVRGATGNEVKERLIFQPTCNICGITTGYQGPGSKTVLPAKASAKLDFRLVPDQNPDEILKLLREHLDEQGFEDVKIERGHGSMPAKTDVHDPIVKTVLGGVPRIYGHEAVVHRMTPGTGPMHTLCQSQGIPSVQVGVGHHESQNHAPNENIYVEDFVSGIKMIAHILDEFPRQAE